MERHRKANAFPDLGTPGDPRLLAAIERRTPGIAGGGINHFFGGTVITPPKKSKKSAATVRGLTLVDYRPSYVPVGSPVAEGSKGTWLTWGFCNGRLPSNWTTRIDSPLSGTYTKFFMLKVNIVSAGTQLKISSCEWEAWDTFDEKEDDEWGENGARPSFVYLLLGTLYVTDGVPFLGNNGTGSIRVMEHVSDISQNGSLGFTYNKSFSFDRLLQ